MIKDLIFLHTNSYECFGENVYRQLVAGIAREGHRIMRFWFLLKAVRLPSCTLFAIRYKVITFAITPHDVITLYKDLLR